MLEPLIAIPGYRLPPGDVPRWTSGAYAVPAPYVEAIGRAGGLPALLLSSEDERDAADLLLSFSGLLLIGGGDVEPARYDAPHHPHQYGVDPSRDAFEIGLVRAADRLAMPTLAICRGAQVLDVAFGGSLHQHLPDVVSLGSHGIPGEPPVIHDVTVAEDSLLAAACGSRSLTCSSHHHQGVERIGEGLRATAWSRDGLVEALERDTPADASWIVGVQWHPEDTNATDPAQQRLFDEFVRQVREWSLRRT
jgi:putative glutamine amidotransferase